jgi:two-component system, chemotaxis family, response regulator Rcp1
VSRVSAPAEIEILLVEDNPGDVHLTREALVDGKVHNNLHVVNDGSKALAFLRGEGEYTGSPRPDLILLDLDLPRLDGREVLETIRSDESLQDIPVVILTSSQAEQDIVRARSLKAEGYLRKPVDLDQLILLVRSVDAFWLTITCSDSPSG